jgi:DNA-binding NarL/FixJ family response regulator
MSGVARDAPGSGVSSTGRTDDLRVAVISSSAVTRREIGEAIANADAGLDVQADLADVDQLLLSHAPPDVIVVETGSERPDGIRAARRLSADIVVVAVVPERNRKRLRAALAEGADGIVVRERLESLALTIRAAHAGQVTVPRELRTSLVKPSLSVREKQVLGMVVMGFTNGEIAARLVLAESTIKSHLSSAFAKLGVRSRGEAAELILDPANGLGPGILSIAEAQKLGPDLVLEGISSLASR